MRVVSVIIFSDLSVIITAIGVLFIIWLALAAMQDLKAYSLDVVFHREVSVLDK